MKDMGIEAKLQSDTLAIGKDSNGIRVRSSCLGFHKGEEQVQEEDGATESSGSSQLRNETEANKRSNRKERNNTVNTQASTWHDAQTSMMHVRFKKNAWHGKVHKQILQVKWRSICNELHIDETPHLFIQLTLV